MSDDLWPSEEDAVGTTPQLVPVFLTLKQFSILVGMAPNTVRDRLEKGQVRGAKSGRLWRIPVTEIGRMLG